MLTSIHLEMIQLLAKPQELGLQEGQKVEVLLFIKGRRRKGHMEEEMVVVTKRNKDLKS